MKNTKITKDCFVNVRDWTDEEVLEAAEVFVENVEDVRHLNPTWLDTNIEGYDYLLILQDGEVFVGNSGTLSLHNRFKELTKEDFFGEASENNHRGIHITFNPDDIESVTHFIDTMETTLEMKLNKEEDFKVGDKVVVKDLPDEMFKRICILNENFSGRELTIRSFCEYNERVNFEEILYNMPKEYLMLKESKPTDFLIEQINNAHDNLQKSQEVLQEAQEQVDNHKEDYESAVQELQNKVGSKGFKIEPLEYASTVTTKHFDRYSYWDVEDWSEEEIQKAAEILSEEFGVEIDDIDVRDHYIYLFLNEDLGPFVGSLDMFDSVWSDVDPTKYNKRTKKDILGYA